MMGEYQYSAERLAYAKGYNIGFGVGLFVGAILMFAAGVLIGMYVPLP